MSTSSRPHWIRQIASRIAILWPVKAVGTMLFMGAFFWGYFGVLSHPLFPTTIMPLIGLDEWVPFTPLAFPAYVSLWVYASLAPALLTNFRTGVVWPVDGRVVPAVSGDILVVSNRGPRSGH
jgi:small-conductance mechanosensitive channel